MMPAGYSCFFGCPYSIPPSSSSCTSEAKSAWKLTRNARRWNRTTMKKPAIIVLCFVVLVLAAVGYYFLHRGPATSDSMPGTAPTMLSLLPPEAPYVIYADVQSLRSSAFLNRLISLAPAPNEDPEYAEFVRSTGFDYTRDLDRIAIAIFPTMPLPTVVTLAEGRFDQQKIIAYALRTGKTEERDGHTVYILPSSTPGGEVIVRFLAANRIALM